ncbi:YwqH-like family protein [Psychrobacillus vulpis]|uniref:YwqH-like family protein n=1 Tax=Psychrobacillus vulpis TaxID=2325572 RepID=UPI001F0FC102|nr:DUF5082 family protein [Psychrobacillus vulpis]
MLGYYYALLAKKQEELRRLIECQSSLSEKQSQFNENEHKCLEPELTATTWYGTLATSFDEIREAGIHTSYLEIAGAQFSAVFSAISNKIASLNAEIESIKQTIADLLAREAEERARARASK